MKIAFSRLTRASKCDPRIEKKTGKTLSWHVFLQLNLLEEIYDIHYIVVHRERCRYHIDTISTTPNGFNFNLFSYPSVFPCSYEIVYSMTRIIKTFSSTYHRHTNAIIWLSIRFFFPGFLHLLHVAHRAYFIIFELHSRHFILIISFVCYLGEQEAGEAQE